MGVFISYSNHDKEAVRALITDLGRARQAVWLDQELYGGDTWWETILKQIRDADVFVLALSNNSERSKPCRTELEYARALGIPVVPVQIGPLDRLRSGAIADLQIVDYRSRNADAAIALIGALHEATARRGPLPEPLPDPPPIPFEYLMRLGRAIDSSHMQPLEQVGVLAQLRQGLDDEDDVGAQRDIAVLLQNMRCRPDVTYQSVKEIDTLLATIDAAPPTEPDRAQNRGNFHRQRPKSRAPSQALVDQPSTKNELPKSFFPKSDRLSNPVHCYHCDQRLGFLFRGVHKDPLLLVLVSESRRNDLWQRCHRPQGKTWCYQFTLRARRCGACYRSFQSVLVPDERKNIFASGSPGSGSGRGVPS